MTALYALVLAGALVAPAQTSPKIVHLVSKATDGVAFETLSLASDGTATVTGRFTLQQESTFPLKLDAKVQVVRFVHQGQAGLTVSAADLALSNAWYVSRMSPSDVFIWSGVGHVPAPAGATLITAEAAACANATIFRLGTMTTYGIRAALHFLTSDDVASCRWLVLGLTPREYEASLSNATGSSGRARFHVVANRTAEVVIPPPAITVSGVVTLNGKPVSGGRVQFRRPPNLQGVVLQDDGSYSTAFDEEGDYELVLISPTSRLKPTRVTLVPGPNVFDWHIDDPSADSELIVRVSGHDVLAATGIEVESDGVVITRGVIPAGEDTFRRTGIPFGKYRVFARQPNAASEWGEVQLSEDVLSASIALSLSRATRSITLRYADGEPVSNAGFANTSIGYEETAPGTYSLASVAANTELMVRPPTGAPLCRVVPREGDVQATVFPGRSLTLMFSGRRAVVDDVKIGTEGHCPVSINLFLKSPLRIRPQRADVEIMNAPPDEVLTIYTVDGAYRVTVPPEGVVFIPAKQ